MSAKGGAEVGLLLNGRIGAPHPALGGAAPLVGWSGLLEVVVATIDNDEHLLVA